MDPGAESPGAGEVPSSAAGAGGGDGDAPDPTAQIASPPPPLPQNQQPQQPPSRYESQKRRDWNTFLQYLRGHKPPLSLGRCGGGHVIEFLKYLDQFGKTKVHAVGCPYYGQPTPPSPCACPLRQAWGSLDALIGRLRAAYEESGGRPESNPFAARPVRVYLREVRESQAKARGIPYEKKKRKRNYNPATTTTTTDPVIGESSSAAAADAPVTVTEEGEGSGAKSSPPPPAEGSKPTS